jgi:hypothetical protein
MSDDYSADQIAKLNVPEWRPVGEDWVREWTIDLEQSPSPDGLEQLQRGLQDPRMTATRLSLAASGTVVVTTTTRMNPFSDDVFWFAAYDMLRRIDAQYAIRRIQGQPRAVWQPFRPALQT